jgi:hypothetical protein
MQRMFLTGLLYAPKHAELLSGETERGDSQKNHRKLFVALTLLVISACTTMMLVACAPTKQARRGEQATPSPFNVASTQTPFSGKSGRNGKIVTLQVPLSHSPRGTALLSWSPTDQTLRVGIIMSGLAPNSTHPARVYAASCTQTNLGQILYQLKPVIVDATGLGTSQTTILGVQGGIPSNQWAINVHNGPNMTSDMNAVENRSLACANITTVHTGPQGDPQANVTFNPNGTTSPDEHAAGMVTLTLEQTATDPILQKVVITMSGLIPGSRHVAHVHSGSCVMQGPILFPLTTLQADGHGNVTAANSTATTIINQPITKSMNVYINVHEGATMQALQQTQFFNPIACSLD